MMLGLVHLLFLKIEDPTKGNLIKGNQTKRGLTKRGLINGGLIRGDLIKRDLIYGDQNNGDLANIQDNLNSLVLSMNKVILFQNLTIPNLSLR